MTSSSGTEQYLQGRLLHLVEMLVIRQEALTALVECALNPGLNGNRTGGCDYPFFLLPLISILI